MNGLRPLVLREQKCTNFTYVVWYSGVSHGSSQILFRTLVLNVIKRANFSSRLPPIKFEKVTVCIEASYPGWWSARDRRRKLSPNFLRSLIILLSSLPVFISLWLFNIFFFFFTFTCICLVISDLFCSVFYFDSFFFQPAILSLFNRKFSVIVVILFGSWEVWQTCQNDVGLR